MFPITLGGTTSPALTEIEEAVAYYVSARGITRPQPWVIAMNSTYPAIAYTVVSTTEPMVIQGASSLATTRIQLSCFASTYKAARQLTKALRNVLQGFSGVVSGVVIDCAWMDSASDQTEPLQEGTEKPTFHRSIDCMVNWRIGYPNL